MLVRWWAQPARREAKVAVHCSKCGEELLGAVNRCWRCGQAYAVPPPNTPPSSSGSGNELVLAAAVVEHPGTERTYKAARRQTTAELIDARKAGLMAMGGTVTSLVLGLLATLLAFFWPPAAIIAVIGLGMGIWGLSSPRRNLALVGMLLCCLAIGVGTFGIARQVSIAIQKNRALSADDLPPSDN
jgi:hypothetical protein